MVTNKHLRLAMETEEERRARLEWRMMQYQMAQFGHVDGQRKKSKTEEDGSYQTAQVGLGDG